MTQETYDLDRETKIEASVDALGKKWVIKFNKQNGLCHTRPEPDRSDAVIPESMKGQFTKATIIQELIKTYVTRTWDIAAKAKEAAERKIVVAKEQAKAAKEQAKVTKVKDDARATHK